MENKIFPGAGRNSGHVGTNIPNAPEERDNRGASGFPRSLFQHIPGTQSFRRVASSNRFKKIECSHFGTLLLSVHYKLCSKHYKLCTVRKGDYTFKIDLQAASFMYQYIQASMYLRFALRKQSLSILSTSLRSEHSPSGFYSFGTHYGRLPPSSGDFGYSIPQQLVSSPPGP